ncbi:cell division protein FtsZ [Christiangramia forsetii]|uniref:Cell division protein FtsZ n=2 Tax=Christiangramia forsetii TaxID=411153 RepID=A0M523_CHRFK|nr:cell division protein FtsZ [Christiangramia forsetii]GGG22037.1 cell division protein FtsZ [Christiangramia forsetii]CAL67718.1 cell division protein FtsZ [Christiangramia forsetii KT0803]
MSSKEFGDISFDLPKNQSNVIKVIGVGGGGSNAINHMFQLGIKGVDFVVCNTDSQALDNSSVPNKIQLGVTLTEGLGAGANPEVGEKAAVESFEEIKQMLDTNTKMVFITAGMGGGTGTGAAPIIAKQAKELGILTVGIVTIPFQFEGKNRNEQAQLGVERLRQNVDSLIVINNNKLREVYGNLGFKAGFSKADEVLATASRGIAEVITHHYTQNIDLRDAKTVLSKSGTAIMGSAQASGASRATDAIMKALDSPLLNDNKITGAKNVLLLIVSGNEEITIDEIGEINDHIQAEAGHSANIIMGVGEDEALEDAIAVTIIATGFDVEQQNEITNTETKKIIHTLEDEQRAEQDLTAKRSAPISQVTNAPVDDSPKNELQFEEPAKDEKIVHTLDESEEEVDEVGNIHKKVDDVLKTPDFARKLDVTYEEIDPEDFIINDAGEAARAMEANKPEDEKSENEEQFMFTFDMPMKKEEAPQSETSKKVTRHSLEDEEIEERTKNIQVNEPVEIVPVTESSAQGVKRYSLDDYMEMEEKLEKSKAPKKEEIKDETIAFEKKTVAPSPERENTGDGHDPFDNPISSEVVRQRTAERKAKMKEFNYKFRTGGSAQIDEIEKQPAYKRAGIELDNSKPGEGKLSRTSIDQDDNNDLHFRKNNSFLHDNVD